MTKRTLKTVVPKKAPKKSDSEMIELMLQALRLKYSYDSCAPGLLLSYIRNGQDLLYYGAIKRYKAFGQQMGDNVAAAKAKTLRELINTLSAEIVKESPVEQLRRQL